MKRNRNPPQIRHPYPHPPRSAEQYQRRKKSCGPITRGRRPLRHGPYVVPHRPIHGPIHERLHVDILHQNHTEMILDHCPSLQKMQLDKRSQQKKSPPAVRKVTPPKSKSPAHQICPPTFPLKPIFPTDSWRIHYLIEKERLSVPAESKPSGLVFFTTSPKICIKESKDSPRTITKIYKPDHIFGTAPVRKVHLREIPVNFFQIWNRSVITKRCRRQGQDSEGYLVFEEQELKIQLQRHHVPGTLFFASEAGDFDINDPSMIAPDVCYRMVDVAGQQFIRAASVYDLKGTVEVEEGQLNASLLGIDGKEISFEIEGRKQVRLPGEGLSRNWEGTNRGDLIIDIIVR